MRYVNVLLIYAVLALFGAGCSQVPVVILRNNTAADIGIVYKDTIVWVKSNSEHEVPNGPVHDSHGNVFDTIIIRNREHYGYQFNYTDLLKFTTPRNVGFKMKYHLALNEDGSIVFPDQRRGPSAPLPGQPQGFPMMPIRLK
jgi:hypothetical protein